MTGPPASKEKVWARRAVVAAVVLAVGGVIGWAFHPLRGLPDIGDPFDVAEARALAVDPAENAFILYQVAAARVVPNAVDAPPSRWDQAGPSTRAWVEANRPALELWREGAERPDALYLDPATARYDTLLPVTQELRRFAELALLEASRLEGEGDLAGAWGWYRAVLRSGVHSGRNGGVIERMVGGGLFELALAPIKRWAADPRVDATLRARALAEAREARAMSRPWSHTLKLEYLVVRNSLEDTALARSTAFMGSIGLARRPLFTVFGRTFSLDDFRRSRPVLGFQAEPEASRRLARLVYANWLAHVDLPAADRPPLLGGELPLFQARTRGMAPEEIASRVAPRPLASAFLPGPISAFEPRPGYRTMPDAEEGFWRRIERALGPKSGPPAP
jgi:hypothetical protein